MTTQKLKWTKGLVLTSRYDREECKQVKDVFNQGYITKDTDVFGIHRDTYGVWVVDHLDSGMIAARTAHLTVAKQVVVDLLTATDNWIVEEGGQLPDWNQSTIDKIGNIRSAARGYSGKKGSTNVERYISYRDKL